MSVDSQQAEAPSPMGAFLEIFVIRSFRESHLEEVVKAIKDVVDHYTSPYWGAMAATLPYRLVDMNQELISGRWVRDEICRKISNAAICIVILDGMRPNVFFELGFLQAWARPFILLKHRQYGPSFAEIDSDVSDLKGQVFKEYDHQDGDTFRSLLKSEIARCDEAFINGLGTHLVVPRNDRSENLADKSLLDRWKRRGDNTNPEWAESGLRMSSGPYEIGFTRHVTRDSLFMVRFDLLDNRSKLTVYVKGEFRRASSEVSIWFGYSSRAVVTYGDHRGGGMPVEITIPLSVSGPNQYELVDNIWDMVSDRLSTEFDGPLRISAICLWAEDGPVAVSEVKITG